MTEHLQNPSRGAMLQAVNQTSFAVVEANLYLDTHPCDMEALSYLNQMMEAYKNAKAPLNAGNVTENAYWTWVSDPWPWEGGNL